MNDNQRDIIAKLGMEIAMLRACVAGEREAPRYDADRSDDYIKQNRSDAMKLMAIREQLEEIFFGEMG